MNLLHAPNGLILVTGKVGMGKTTTLAAFVEAINQEQAKAIITLEDPIEYVYQGKKSIISQRELGRDFFSFPQALKSALRESADIILIGEIRDKETALAAMNAAETGALVLGTLHTKSAAEAPGRIAGMWPVDERDGVLHQFADVFLGIFAQELLPAKGGRVCAMEALTATTASKNLIRQMKFSQLPSLMLAGTSQGMETFETSLKKLFARGAIDRETMFLAMERRVACQ